MNKKHESDYDVVRTCPQCGSKMVLSESVELWHVNRLERHRHAVKPHSPESKAYCQDDACGWSGVVADLDATSVG